MLRLWKERRVWYAEVRYSACGHTREGAIHHFEKAVQGKANSMRKDCPQCRPEPDPAVKYDKWMARARALERRMGAKVQLIWQVGTMWHAEMMYDACGHWRCAQISHFERHQYACRDCAEPPPARWEEEEEARLDAYLASLSHEDMLELYNMMFST